MNKNIFQNGEGDCYFSRNISIYENDEITSNDIIIKNIQNIRKPLEKLNILEIGCSSGFRLNALNNLFPNNNYFGFDPSKDAIHYAKQNYNNINFEILTCDDINFYEDKKFDIIMIPFVMVYIDRELLLKSISEIDRILKNNGILIITDFYSNRPRKNIYKHTDNTFIYKQNFFEIFLSTNNYFLNKLECFYHITTNNNDNYDDTCYYVELKKDLLNLFN